LIVSKGRVNVTRRQRKSQCMVLHLKGKVH